MGLTANATTGVVGHLYQTVYSVTYKVGASYYNAHINKINKNAASIDIYITCPNVTTGEMTITEINVYNTKDQLWFTEIINVTASTDLSFKLVADVAVS